MSPSKPKLKVTPELCEGCRPGHYDCERACKQGAIRVGKGFVYIDWDRCDGCLECVHMCDSGALEVSSALSAAAPPAASGQATAESVNPAAQARPSTPKPPLATPAPEAGVWTEVDGLIALTVMLAGLFALNRLLDLRIIALMPQSGRVISRAAVLTVSYLIELGVVWLLAKRHGVGLGRALGLRPVFRSLRSTLVSAGLVLALLVGTRLLTTLYGVITRAFEWEPVFQWDESLARMFGGGRSGLALAMFLVVIFGPLVEEITFRGVVQSAARRRWGLTASVLISSALFAVYHFDPWLFVPIFVLGVALGWLAENRRGLWPPVALHVLYNSVTVFAVFWLAAK